ncbi:unnamed protein product [marine sediment metagenome]|uniref:Uncharacterized protein n=1 Tax=marine sediment metagenome TaxID=412755 RepID=X1IB24_9ZZZZ
MKSHYEQRSQTACDSRADLHSKGVGSKACTEMYRFRDLSERIGLASRSMGNESEPMLEAS